VSLLARISDSLTLRRLRRTAEVQPTPRAYAELADHLVQKGRTLEAYEWATRGLRMFPDAKRIADVRRFAQRQQMLEEITSLTQRIATSPNPALYARLAMLYHEVGDHTRAEEVCIECGERFPDDEATYLVTGEIRVDRFLADGLARDAEKAVENLERVAELNTGNVRCHLLLARVFHAVGALDACCAHLRKLLQITPAATKTIRPFLAAIEARIQEWGDSGKDLDELYLEVEKNGTFANDPWDFPRYRGMRHSALVRDLNIDNLRASMADLAWLPGVQRALVLDDEGEILLEAGRLGNPPQEVFTQLVRTLGETADGLSRRMDIGTLTRADLKGPFGTLHLIRFPGALCGILGNGSSRTSDALDEFMACGFSEGVA